LPAKWQSCTAAWPPFALGSLTIDYKAIAIARIYLSPPELSPTDREQLLEALDGGWIAPVGPEIDRLEAELAIATDRREAVALASGTAALHLALIVGGISAGDRVLVSSLTFAASANAVRYVGAEPVFVDSDRASWNVDPDLLAEALEDARRTGQRYAAVIPVDLYGQCADYQRIEALCAEHEVLLIEDAAESLGASYRERKAGSFGAMAVLSFNGNKIITTSGGGALLTDRPEWAAEVRFLATQARDDAVHYEHSRLGYNYRLSNLLAALGRSQLADLERRVEARRGHNAAYRAALREIDGIAFMPEAPGCRSTFWLTTLTIDPEASGASRQDVQKHLESLDIEARPVWKPMHLQPLYEGCHVVGGTVSADLFERGLCLPSGSSLTTVQRERVIGGVLDVLGSA
jgi:dTDP-4-amino-4,6-dideoxygalactose transaminase